MRCETMDMARFIVDHRSEKVKGEMYSGYAASKRKKGPVFTGPQNSDRLYYNYRTFKELEKLESKVIVKLLEGGRGKEDPGQKTI